MPQNIQFSKEDIQFIYNIAIHIYERFDIQPDDVDDLCFALYLSDELRKFIEQFHQKRYSR